MTMITTADEEQQRTWHFLSTIWPTNILPPDREVAVSQKKLGHPTQNFAKCWSIFTIHSFIHSFFLSFIRLRHASCPLPGHLQSTENHSARASSLTTSRLLKTMSALVWRHIRDRCIRGGAASSPGPRTALLVHSRTCFELRSSQNSCIML